MESLNVEIINPKAKTLLRNLAAMNLIHIKNQPTLASMLATLRRNEAQIPSLEEITQEVELVRQACYDRKKQITPAKHQNLSNFSENPYL